MSQFAALLPLLLESYRIMAHSDIAFYATMLLLRYVFETCATLTNPPRCGVSILSVLANSEHLLQVATVLKGSSLRGEHALELQLHAKLCADLLPKLEVKLLVGNIIVEAGLHDCKSATNRGS